MKREPVTTKDPRPRGETARARRKTTLRGKLILLIAVLYSLALATTALVTIMYLNRESRADIREYRADGIEEVRKVLQNYVGMAYESVLALYKKSGEKSYLISVYGDQLHNVIDIVASYIHEQIAAVKRGAISTRVAQSRVKQFVQELRYDHGTGYVWINNTTLPYPRMILHPIDPSLNGKIMNNPRYNCALGEDKNLFQAVVEVTAGSQKGDGYVDYLWPKPGQEGLSQRQPKLSYVQRIPEWNWIIGTGIYVDDAVAETKQRAVEIIKQMRYDHGEGYFWINDNSLPYPRTIMHPIDPSLDGKIMSDPKFNRAFGEDKNLFQAFVEVTAASKDGGGYVDYLWPKPGSTVDQPKLSYVRLFKPWGWIIGTGVYIDNIDVMVAEKKQQLALQIRGIIITLGVITLGGAFVAMVLIALLVARSMKPLEQMKLSVGELIVGNLTRSIAVSSRDDIGAVVMSFQQFQARLRSIIRDVKEVSVKNHSIGEELSANSEETSAAVVEIMNSVKSIVTQMSILNDHIESSLDAVQQILNYSGVLDGEIEGQHASISQSSAGIEQMNANLISIDHIADEKKRISETLLTVTTSGKKQVQRTIEGIEEVTKAADKITEVIDIINHISDNTNLLAMNAAIEAAHAGEAGKGFAVVAGEIRKLAQSTALNTQTITESINRVMDKIHLSLDSSTESGRTFEQLSTEVAAVADAFQEISGAIKEVSTGSKEITSSIIHLKEISTSVKHGSSEMRNSAEGILKKVEELQSVYVNSSDGIAKIEEGVGQINDAAREVANLSEANTQNLNEVNELMKFFKT